MFEILQIFKNLFVVLLVSAILFDFHKFYSFKISRVATKDLVSPILVSNIASQLDFAASSAARLYGKDIEIGDKALTFLVTYESARSGPKLVSSDDHRFVEVINLL